MTSEEETKTLERLKIITKVHEILIKNDIPYMVVGGFAQDAHQGKITRHHKDIDILIPKEYKDSVQQLSPQFGYPKLEEYGGYKLHGGTKHHIDVLYFWKVNDGYLTKNFNHAPTNTFPKSFLKREEKSLNFCDTRFSYFVAPLSLIEYFKNHC